MTTKVAHAIRCARRPAMVGATLLTLSFGFLGLGANAASADVVYPDTDVSSRQAEEASRGAIRTNSTQGEVRTSKPGEVRAQGEVRDYLQAEPDKGTRGKPFRGPWGGANNLNQFKFLGQNPY